MLDNFRNKLASDKAKIEFMIVTEKYWKQFEKEANEYFAINWQVWCNDNPEWFESNRRAISLGLLPENMREEERRFRLRDPTGRKQSVVRRLS